MNHSSNYVRNGISHDRRPAARVRRSSSHFMRTPHLFKIFFAFVVVMMVVAGIYAFSSRNDFANDCASKGGTASQQYSYSAGQWVQVCKNSDGAITDFR